MASIVVARGSKWGSATLLDGWGDGPEGFEIEMARLATSRFEDLVQDRGDCVFWFGSTSEVVGDEDTKLDGDELAEIREQAVADVWQALTENEGPLAAEVAAVIEMLS